jgi:hypothetical protein
VYPGRLIDRRERAAYRPAANLPGHAHDAAEGLQDYVVAQVVLERPGAPKSGNAAIDDVVALAFEAGEIDAQAFGDAGAVALERDVGAPGKLVRDVASLLRFKVDGETALIAVSAEEDRAGVAAEGRPGACFVAGAARLDLDDFGAEIAEILRTERAG